MAVLVLLPPSESKTVRRRGAPVDLASLSLPELQEPRRRVLTALAEASARPDALAVLEVPRTLQAEVDRNRVWDTAPAVPVSTLYSGVLYDALDHAGLDAGAKRRARTRLLVMSAVHGALRPDDRVAPYRVHVCAHLPLGPGGERVELKDFWRDRLVDVLPAQADGLVVDCRSTSYAAMWRTRGEVAERTVAVRVLQELAGRRSVVSHMAKHTRGLVARHLVSRTGRDPRTPDALAAAVGEVFDVELGPPAHDGRRVLDVVVRPGAG